jgi:single stranded DNA-binding protein
MSQGGYATVVGFVAQDPIQRLTKDGTRVTDLRVGTTRRVQDRATSQWRDADTSYFTVSCWRRLGDHVRASLRKGDPVVVKGRLRSRTYDDKNGQPKYVVDIVADTVGHDLNRGVANYMRQRPQPVSVDGDPAANGAPGPAGERDLADENDMVDDADEEAMERFEQELGDGLNEAELAAQALGEGQAADVTAPPVSY